MQNHHDLFPGKTLRVVIDAGHGGVDPGTTINGIPEKNINLLIAKKIKELSKEYNVEVIMTRDKDELSGKGENIANSLKYRTNLPEKENADLFISIHVNGMGQQVMQDEYSGFDIYIPDNTSKVYDGSLKLASIIAGYIKPDYTIAPELKQRKDRIQVLDNATVPAILIECGYMDNKSDMAYLRDEKHQEKIARDILEGIRKYSMQTTSYLNAINASTDTIPVEKITEQDLIKLNSDMIASVNVDKKEIQGTVIVEFIVRKDGSLTDIHAISGPESLRDESIRAVKESGKWVPAKQNGLIVDSYHKQPFNFKLEKKS